MVKKIKSKVKKTDNCSSVFTQVVCNNFKDVNEWKKKLRKVGWTDFEVTKINKWIIRGVSKK